MRVLVVNAGSSSLKLDLLDGDDTVQGHESIEVSDGEWDSADVAEAVRDLGTPDAVGHRVVHGGREFTMPVRIDDEVMERLDALTDLAPLHQPKSLAGIAAVRAELPDVPAVACFDTAFHAHLPEPAATYALPQEWRAEYGIRRYGFHGLSHAYATRRAGELAGGASSVRRAVVCHLGAGASLAAVLDGRSVDTTMGFTPLEGLVMATRSGSVDPGLLLWLHTHAGIAVAELERALEHRSGLRGLAGTPDLKAILASAADGDDAATLARDTYLHRLRAGIASMTAALGGLDVLVFTGGVGEGAAGVRQAATDGLAYLGTGVDPRRNAAVDGDADITADGARVRTFVVAAREDVEIAAGVRQVLVAA
ncbi:MAG: acetate/propionate family kinase [Streptosporangiales bacterium]|nr:acetate/propionate family kinase [Streptosporangiales bacterium]